MLFNTFLLICRVHDRYAKQDNYNYVVTYTNPSSYAGMSGRINLCLTKQRDIKKFLHLFGTPFFSEDTWISEEVRHACRSDTIA